MPENLGDELYLSDVSQKDKPWDAHRTTATTVQEHYSGSQYQSYAERISACSRLLEFKLVQQEDGEQKFHLNAARFCRVRLCPVCQWRRSLMWVGKFINALPRIRQDYPKARWIFLTLTVKNCELDELRETIKWMNHSFKKMTKRTQWPSKGWAKSLEVTRNAKDGTAHPHFHVLMMVPTTYFSKGYLKQSKWRELWQSCLKSDYLPVVNVKTVKPKPNADGKDAAIVSAIRETFKYSVKPGDLAMESSWLEELTTQLHGSRAIEVSGVLRQYMKDDEPEDLIHSEDNQPEDVSEEDPTLCFGWRENASRYAKVDLNNVQPSSVHQREVSKGQSQPVKAKSSSSHRSGKKKRGKRVQMELDID